MSDEPEKVVFLAKLSNVQGKGPKDLGGTPEAKIEFVGTIVPGVAAVLWDFSDGHSVKVTVERTQPKLTPELQGWLGGPEQEAPCADCGMMKGHSETCPVMLAAKAADETVRNHNPPPAQATETAPRPSRKRKAATPETVDVDSGTACGECHRMPDDHAFGCSVGEARRDSVIDFSQRKGGTVE